MALFQKVTIIDERGQAHVIEGGLFTAEIQIKQAENAVCVTKEDVFGVNKETTCIQQPQGRLRIGKG